MVRCLAQCVFVHSIFGILYIWMWESQVGGCGRLHAPLWRGLPLLFRCLSLYSNNHHSNPPPFQKNKFTPVRSVQCSEWVIVSYFGDAFTSTELVGFLKKNGLFRLLFTLFYRTQVYLGSDLWVRDSLTPTPMWNFTSYTSLTCPPV